MEASEFVTVGPLSTGPLTLVSQCSFYIVLYLIIHILTFNLFTAICDHSFLYFSQFLYISSGFLIKKIFLSIFLFVVIFFSRFYSCLLQAVPTALWIARSRPGAEPRC